MCFISRLIPGGTSTQGDGRERYYTAPHWNSARSEISDGAGRLVQMIRGASLVTACSTYFNWLGDIYTGRMQQYQGHMSPFREEVHPDGFGATDRIVYRAIDLDNARQPLHTAEGALYCPGVWDVAACGKPLLELELKRDSMGRTGSMGWQFSHPQVGGGILQQPNHPYHCRGYTYDAREHISSAWEQEGGAAIITAGLQNYHVEDHDLQTVAPNAAIWAYQREAAVGGTNEIINSNNASARFRLPTPRGKGHQLVQVETNGTAMNVYHNASGQIVAKGQDQFIYHPQGQLAYIMRNNKMLESYLYDAEGRLSGIIDEQNNLKSILFDGHQMIAAVDSSGTALWEATWGRGIDKLLEWIEYPSNKVFAALADSRNSVVGLWNVDAYRMEALADYSPEGLTKIYSPDYTLLQDESSTAYQVGTLLPSCNFAFGSLWKSSASKLVWMRNRWYSPDLEQFISSDPMGYVDGYNLFNYTQSDCINKNDAFGLSSSRPAQGKRIIILLGY